MVIQIFFYLSYYSPSNLCRLAVVLTSSLLDPQKLVRVEYIAILKNLMKAWKFNDIFFKGTFKQWQTLEGKGVSPSPQ